jgi:hypothetical protein
MGFRLAAYVRTRAAGASVPLWSTNIKMQRPALNRSLDFTLCIILSLAFGNASVGCVPGILGTCLFPPHQCPA